MSKQRFIKVGYPKGPNGERLCRYCQSPVPKGRRTFCGQKCVNEYLLRSDPKYIRGTIFRRDNGVCAKCGVNTELVKRQAAAWDQANPSPHSLEWRFRLDSGQTDLVALAEAVAQHRLNRAAALGGNWPHPRRTYWHADHIVEVVNGGGQCGLENYQTLCVLCHKAKTAELARTRAAKRKQKAPKETAKLLV